MKKIIFISMLFLIASCSGSNLNDCEAQKTYKSSSSSSRIDNVQSGSNKILKDINE